MPQQKAVDKDTDEFREIFSGLNSNNKQYALAIIRSLQFAEEQERERRAKELIATGGQGGKKIKGGDAPC